MDLDINSLVNAVFEQNEASANVAAKITGNYSQVQAIGDQRALEVATAGESDAIVAGQKAAGELRALENSRRMATSIGTNMDDSSELMTALGLAHREAAAEAISAKEIVRQKSSVGLFDDPITYIMNSITIGDDMNYAEAAQAKVDQISTTLAQVNQATQSTVLTQNAIAETQTAATVQAVTDGIRAKASEQALQVKQQNLIYNVEGLKAVNALTEQQLGNLFQAKGAINAEKQLQMAQAQLEQSRKSFEIQLAERQEKLAAKKVVDQELIDLGNTINEGRSIMGLAPIPPSKAIQMMKIGGDLGNQIKHQYTVGASAGATGAKVIAETPGQAAVIVASTQAPLSPGMRPVRNLLTGAISEVAAGRVKGPTGLPVDLKDKNAVLAATNEAVIRTAKGMASNIKVGDATNIYAAPGLDSIVSTVPAVVQTQLYKKVLAPLVNTGLTEVNPTQIVSLAAEGVSKGNISFNDAADGVVKLFSAATITNNVVRDYVRVGISPQNSFNSVVTVKNSNTPDSLSFMTEESMRVNLLNATEVNNILSKQLRARVVNKVNWITPQKDESGVNSFLTSSK